jgi:hypothetical protein
MSTKSSLKYETDEASGGWFHLYREVFDKEGTFVYLELGGVSFESASSADLSGQGQPTVTVRIPEEWARKLGLLSPTAHAADTSDGIG